MSNSFLPLSSGLEKDSIISTVARRLLPGHKILIRNNHAALKWELQAAKSQIINKIFNGRNVLLTQPLEQIKAGRQRAAASLTRLNTARGVKLRLAALDAGQAAWCSLARSEFGSPGGATASLKRGAPRATMNLGQRR